VPAAPPSKTRGGFPPWSPRTIVILVPLHLLAFAALYLAVYHFTMHEVTDTYKKESGLLLTEALHNIRTAMSCSTLNTRMEEFSASHEVLGLSLYDAGGEPISPDAVPDPRLADFLASDSDREVSFESTGSGARLTAMARIRATGDCSPCHVPGTLLGAVLVTRDLTGAMNSTRHRIRAGLALLVGGWIVLAAAVNVGSRRLAAASVDALKVRVASRSGRRGLSGISPLGMDPISHELYLALESTLREQRERQASMEDCIERAERLASIGQLAAGLAHEIKNPLAGIQGALELLAEDCTNDEQVELYRRMLDELRRVNQTLHSLLHFARPTRPRRIEVGVKDLLEDIAGLVRPGLSRRDILVNLDTDERVTTFPLDQDQIRQAMVNLITNAADAIGDSGRIEILARPFPDGRGLILAVADDGHGVDETTQQAMFEPFFTTKLHGTGLGLAVARKIIEEHGGRIEVSSAPGEGTTVFLILPDPGALPPSGADPETEA